MPFQGHAIEWCFAPLTSYASVDKELLSGLRFSITTTYLRLTFILSYRFFILYFRCHIID